MKNVFTLFIALLLASLTALHASDNAPIVGSIRHAG